MGCKSTVLYPCSLHETPHPHSPMQQKSSLRMSRPVLLRCFLSVSDTLAAQNRPTLYCCCPPPDLFVSAAGSSSNNSRRSGRMQQAIKRPFR